MSVPAENKAEIQEFIKKFFFYCLNVESKNGNNMKNRENTDTHTFVSYHAEGQNSNRRKSFLNFKKIISEIKTVPSPPSSLSPHLTLFLKKSLNCSIRLVVTL